MKNDTITTRSMTISTRVTPAEKVTLQRLAEKHNTSLYDFLYTLAINFQNHYEYIGQDSPVEERLKKELELERVTVRRQTIELENAATKIKLDDKTISTLRTENIALKAKIDELNYDLKTTREEILSLKQTILTLSDQDTNPENNPSTGAVIGLWSVIGVITLALALPGFRRN